MSDTVISHTRTRVEPGVAVAGTRFKLGPHQYVVKPPYGDGKTRYNTRDEALEAHDEAKEEHHA